MSQITHVGKLPAFVVLGGTWESFDAFILYDWEIVAAAAWMGFVATGKGVVILDSATFTIAYAPADAAGMIEARALVPLLTEARASLLRALHGHCRRYHQEREIVVVLKGAASANAAREGRTTVFAAVIPTPRGWLTPPAAYEAFQGEARGEMGFPGLQHRWQHQRRRFHEGGVPAPAATLLGSVPSA